MGKEKRGKGKGQRNTRGEEKLAKRDTPNKPEKNISQTKFHYDRSYYGKELLQ